MATATTETLLFITKEIEWRKEKLYQIASTRGLAELSGKDLARYRRLQFEIDRWARRAHSEFAKVQKSRAKESPYAGGRNFGA